MTWAPLLLSSPSPCLRYLLLTELLGENEEANELRGLREQDPLVTGLTRLQNQDGSWGRDSAEGTQSLQVTSQALTRLGYFGFDREFTPVRLGSEYLFSRQCCDGSWPLGGYSVDAERQKGYDVMSLQTSLPLRGLAECGYAEDPRAEKAYDWLIGQRLEDGAWPTGVVGDVYGYVAGYRRLPHSRWGCRSNTTSALVCLSLHPRHRHGEEASRALDLLLGRETRERHHLGYDTARAVGYEQSSGFITYYARYDMAQVLRLCHRIGAGVDDARVGELVDYVEELKGEYGLWTYLPRPEASRWVTFDILRSLSGLDAETGWISMEPRTPFQPYPSRRKRF